MSSRARVQPLSTWDAVEHARACSVSPAARVQVARDAAAFDALVAAIPRPLRPPPTRYEPGDSAARRSLQRDIREGAYDPSWQIR
jgi:hypothetical protein